MAPASAAVSPGGSDCRARTRPRPAGPGEHTGQHHLLIDVATLPPAGQPIPNDERHEHFGGGRPERCCTSRPARARCSWNRAMAITCRSSRRWFRRQSRSM
ncbi:MAG TPA: DUF4399 domain-containing protein [Rhodanobacteraceae bacterium]|nr:DUF4399 domain-containing protein [Rhodanobacteraceae bacterium]